MEVAIMTDVPDEVQRWTAKRKAAEVMSIVNGHQFQVVLIGTKLTQNPIEVSACPRLNRICRSVPRRWWT
jgi:hypothetical protein